MNYRWTILPLALAIVGCDDKRDEETAPNFREFTVSGEVFGQRHNQGNIDIYAGEQLLGSVDIDQSGQYSMPVSINDSIYNHVRNEGVYLISRDASIQLASYLGLTLQDAVNSRHISSNLSSLSTSQYVVADINNDGKISADEWQLFSQHSQSDTMNKSILQYSASLQTVLEGNAATGSSGSLQWLTDLKSANKWNPWFAANKVALEEAWELLFVDPLATEANDVLELGTGIIDDWYGEYNAVISDKEARCELLIVPPSDIDPHNGRVGDRWELSSVLTDRVTGIEITGQQPIWGSNNPYVASMSPNGVVTLNGAGSASISASFNYEGDSCADTFPVTVFERDEVIEIESIQIGTLPAEISIEESVQLTANAFWSNGSASDVSNLVEWSVEPEGSASIDGQWLTAIKAGELIIGATYQGEKDNSIITVREEDILPPELESLSLSGYDGAKKPGQSWHLTATGHYDDESVRDLTESSEWSSSNNNIATVSHGIVNALSAGEAEVTATFEGVARSLTVVVDDEDVIDPEIVSIRIVGDTDPKQVGDRWQLTATALLDNDQERDITGQANWVTSNSNVVIVHEGSVEAVGEGTAIISIALEGQSNTATITVNAYEAELVGIELNAGETELFVGDSAVWGATATFDDDSELDIARQAHWVSSDNSIASVLNGIVTAHSDGDVTITVSYEGKQDSSPMSVEAVVVESLTIASGTDSLIVGESTVFNAMASYNNGHSVDVSRRGQWLSTDTNVAYVLSGVVNTVGVGSTNIRFELDDKAVSTALTVDTDEQQLEKLAIKGDTSVIEKNQMRQIQATASYDNGDEFEVIAQWESSKPDVLSIDAAGRMTAHNIGESTITATYLDQSISVDIEVETDEAQLTKIELIGNVDYFRKGDTQQLTAMAHYDRGESQDVTTSVAWRSTSDDIISVENGLIEGIAPGNANIIITWEGMNDVLSVLVNLPDVETMEPAIFDNVMIMKEGEIHNNKFTLRFSDGTVKDYSSEITYRVATDSDASAKRIANTLTGSSTDTGFRAYRAGETTLTVQGISEELAEHLRHAGVEISWSSTLTASVALTVETNPDTYMWHRTDLGNLQNYTQKAQVFYNETVYQFWEHRVSNVYQGVYVTSFDGETVSDRELVIEDLGLQSVSLLDGGGNGYVLLRTNTANNIYDQYIYHLETGELHLIDFESAEDFTSVNMTTDNDVYSITENGELVYHRLSGNSSSRKLLTDIYSPVTATWSRESEVALGHATQRWIQTVGQQDHYLLLDTYLSSSSTAGYRPPELHFVNRNSGLIDKKIAFRAPLNAEGLYCTNMTSYNAYVHFQIIIEGERVGAICNATVNSANNEYWLWHDITQYPEVFTRNERESWISNAQLAMATQGEITVALGSTYNDQSGQAWREIFEWNTLEHKSNVVQMPVATTTGLANTYTGTYGHYNYDVSNLHLENPHASDELLMLAYGNLLVRDAESGEWHDDTLMFGLPTSISSTQRAYKMNDTWYIYGGSSSGFSPYNYFWRLQLRNPEAEY